MYDYFEAVKADVSQWIEDNEYYCQDHRDSREDFEEWLNYELWTADSVTGNGSGSYTFNRYEAGENLAGNFDLLAEAVEEFGGNMDVLKDGEEACDVTIRCYLLGRAISEVLDEEWEDQEEEEENE